MGVSGAIEIEFATSCFQRCAHPTWSFLIASLSVALASQPSLWATFRPFTSEFCYWRADFVLELCKTASPDSMASGYDNISFGNDAMVEVMSVQSPLLGSVCRSAWGLPVKSIQVTGYTQVEQSPQQLSSIPVKPARCFAGKYKQFRTGRKHNEKIDWMTVMMATLAQKRVNHSIGKTTPMLLRPEKRAKFSGFIVLWYDKTGGLGNSTHLTCRSRRLTWR